ncbi:hypothetical protein AVEN_236227-1 [Araneus ventricosus]|uniref:Uncharacterized protein n=1 Tax=Araneus ventricosus TaxID=182803 RepID=A0A4Y2CC81_ARAVE|nr:hypothetical protein AVEN_236227-1 [Araneus ventricosus]
MGKRLFYRSVADAISNQFMLSFISVSCVCTFPYNLTQKSILLPLQGTQIHSLSITPTPAFSDVLGEPRTPCLPTTHTNVPTPSGVDLWPGSPNGAMDIQPSTPVVIGFPTDDQFGRGAVVKIQP